MTVLITRPQAKAEELKHLLTASGIEAELVPLLSVNPLPTSAWQADLNALLNQTIHGLIFVSPIAVNYFCTSLPNKLTYLKNLPVFAIGVASARCLAGYGFANIIYPQQEENSEGLLTLAQLQNIAGQRFIIVRGSSGRELIATTLRDSSAEVHYLSVYQSMRTELSPAELSLLQQNYQAIVITSTEALRYFIELCQQTRFEHLKQSLVTVMPGQMQALAKQQGLNFLLLPSFAQRTLVEALHAALH